MSIRKRKLLVLCVVAAVLAFANADTIMVWLLKLGVIPFAEYIKSEYLTGTSIAVIAALLFLLPGRAVWAICIRRCAVCDAALLRRGSYCGECGSRV